MHYVYTDYFGSLRCMTNDNGTIEQRLSYDDWGKRRNYQDGLKLTDAQLADAITLTSRGFTGQEHVDGLGLINLNARFYDPALGIFCSPDNYVQAPDNSQNFNSYSYCLNNPLIYTDPSGELIWLIPNIGWSKSGGLSIGLTFMVGIPGVASAQTGVGYSFKSNDFNASVGATAAFNTVYASYSTQSGFSVGWSAGLSPQMGFPISTNFTSVGVNYNITHDSWSGNVSAWGVDKNGWEFNPSVSVMIYPEQTTNLVRGQGFRSNETVYQNFLTNGQQQKALDYFGIKATYDPSKTSTAYVDNAGNTYFGDYPFNGKFDRFSLIADHEMRHTRDVLNYIKKGIDPNDSHLINVDEWNAYSQNYRKQGLYPNSGENNNVVSQINRYGTKLGIYNTLNQFAPRWWHYMYKIPRKW